MKRITDVWMSFNGIRNDDESVGVRLLSMPKREHPEIRVDQKEIYGRHGKLTISEGAYDPIEISVKLTTWNGDINRAMAWLSGAGDLVFSDEPDVCYRVNHIKSFDYEPLFVRFDPQEFTVKFECEPFKYQSVPVADMQITDAGTRIENIGTIYSEPLLHVYCNGNGTIMLGDDSMLLDDIDGDIWIDCDAKTAWYVKNGVTLLQTHKLSGNWMRIEKGVSFINYSGDITQIDITPRWRWI